MSHRIGWHVAQHLWWYTVSFAASHALRMRPTPLNPHTPAVVQEMSESEDEEPELRGQGVAGDREEPETKGSWP